MTDEFAIRDRAALAGTPARALALDCLEAGIAAADPRRVVREAVAVDGETLTVAGSRYDLGDYEEIVVLGGGKAAPGVATALEAVLGDRIDRGAAVTDLDPGDADAPDPLDRTDDADSARVEVLAGDHPVPSERGVESARRVLELADRAGEETLVLAPITGGGSALLSAPADGISLADLRATTNALLDSGATIGEINAVRKHLSALKGGRLAARAAPATIVGLVVSDVVGDDLGVIASGPLVADDSTYEDALGVLERYDIDPPASVRDRLAAGARGEVEETPSAGDPAFERVTVRVLASVTTALEAAAETAREAGYEPLILSSRVRGEAREAAKTHVAVAEEIRATGNPVDPPAVVLSGGETTVTVTGDGEGGPNLEFALSAAAELATPGVALASVDTDGSDGATDAAGAVIDAETVGDRLSADAARDALADNDALAALGAADCVIRTGPTGTNVNDLRALVVAEAGGQ
jgi:hydroxypyruvate reductase